MGNLTLKNNPAFNFATTWCGSDYMGILARKVESGMSTSEAHLVASAEIRILEENYSGLIYSIKSESFNLLTTDYDYAPPSKLTGLLYISCTRDTRVVMADADCEVWVYADSDYPVAVLRNSHLEILDWARWSDVLIYKRQSLEEYAVTTSYPSEWYDLEEKFDELRLKERKKRSKDRSYPENMQDRFRHCIPVREVKNPEFNSTLEFLEWVFGQCYVHDVLKHYAREDRKAVVKARRAKAKKVSIKRRSTRRAKAALR